LSGPVPSRRRAAWRFAALLCILFSGPGSALAGAGPVPPCAGAPEPGYAAPGALPATRVWYGPNLDGAWRPPDCTGWQTTAFGLLTAAAARFAYDSEARGLLGRFAAISNLTTVRYWSVTRQRWRDLIPEAYALHGAERGRHRPDFSVAELLSGQDLYFFQRENTPAGGLIYRMRMREHGTDRLALEIENAEAVRFLGMELFAPGAYQFLYFLEREAPGTWRYYGLMRTGPASRLLLRGYEASYVNRMVAIYRHLAGIPTDREPPAAP
jgi:hypothetical protein